MVTKVDGLFTAISMMRELETGELKNKVGELRKNALNDKVNSQTIDTVMAFDTYKWETAIQRKDKWVVVEQYDNENEAHEGHAKWVKAITETPNMELIDLELWE